MKKELAWLNRWYWPTELAFRKRHCYAPHGAATYAARSGMEGPTKPQRAGRRRGRRKRLRFRPVCRPMSPLPF